MDISKLSDYDKKVIETLLEWGKYSSIEEAAENRHKYELDETIISEEDLALLYLENHPVDSFIRPFINLHALGKHLSNKGFIGEFGYIREVV